MAADARPWRRAHLRVGVRGALRRQCDRRLRRRSARPARSREPRQGSAMTACGLTVARVMYEQDGYLVGPSLVDPALVAEVNERNDAVIAGDYQTGVEPWK